VLVVCDDIMDPYALEHSYLFFLCLLFISEGSTYMGLVKGDLITLSDLHTGESLEHNSWGEGKNERSGESGIFPTDCVAVVGSSSRPTPAVLSLLKEGPAVVARAPGIGTIKRMRLYTLEKYAEEHFRAAFARRSTISRVSLVKRALEFTPCDEGLF